MNQRRRPGDPGSPHVGPISPPSLGEVYEISTRRQRTRYRMIQGTLGVVAIAGVGVAMQSRNGGQVESPDITESASETDSAEPTTQGSLEDNIEESAPAVDRFACAALGDDLLLSWQSAGGDAYSGDAQLTFEEAEELASAWQIPTEEVKPLLGLAEIQELGLVPESIDEAFFDWYEHGHTAEQLGEIAEEWNVSTVSVKVLRLIGGPIANASLDACGVS